ncbi:uncharacterized protein [Periplaneta americana]|uniref:uncharacterized protein n=1 Tax=Periplaneta americana TaxID=6978 RepID=UPI0037E77875
MATKILVTIALFQFGLSAATQFGYAPDETVGSVDDMVQHAKTNVTATANNIKQLVANAQQAANNFLQSLKIQSSDPEGLLALITEDKMAIAAKTPAGVDVSSCTNGNDAKYQSMIQEAGPGIQACLQNVSAALQPNIQELQNLASEVDDSSSAAEANITDCVNENDASATANCLNAVGVQVSDTRDKLVASVQGEISDFQQQVPALGASFLVCTNKVQDIAISESVDIIMNTWICIEQLTSSNAA